MVKNNKLFEIQNRYCQVCGEYIKMRSNLHSCSKKKIKEISKKVKQKEEDEKIRTFDDKLIEFEEYYDSNSYYDNDIGED